MAAAEGTLGEMKVRWFADPAVCVVLASRGYPAHYETGYPIYGLAEAVKEGEGKVAVFHAGTVFKDRHLLTAGGRVLGVTARDEDLNKALKRVYEAVDKIEFEGRYFRRDIAHRAL